MQQALEEIKVRLARRLDQVDVLNPSTSGDGVFVHFMNIHAAIAVTEEFSRPDWTIEYCADPCAQRPEMPKFKTPRPDDRPPEMRDMPRYRTVSIMQVPRVSEKELEQLLSRYGQVFVRLAPGGGQAVAYFFDVNAAARFVLDTQKGLMRDFAGATLIPPTSRFDDAKFPTQQIGRSICFNERNTDRSAGIQLVDEVFRVASMFGELTRVDYNPPVLNSPICIFIEYQTSDDAIRCCEVTRLLRHPPWSQLEIGYHRIRKLRSSSLQLLLDNTSMQEQSLRTVREELRMMKAEKVKEILSEKRISVMFANSKKQEDVQLALCKLRIQNRAPWNHIVSISPGSEETAVVIKQMAKFTTEDNLRELFKKFVGHG
jgi:hypothetical protein